MNIQDIRLRAQELAQKQIAGSITPEEVGGLIEDLAIYAQQMERDGSSLGIRKVYPTLEAMQADTSPSDAAGKSLRRGNLVAIYDAETASTDPQSGMVYRYTGEGWEAVAHIATAMANESLLLAGRIDGLERKIADELQPADKSHEKALEEHSRGIKMALDRLEYTQEDKSRVEAITLNGEQTQYLGADGGYHDLPVQSIEVNGAVLEADESGKIVVTTPQGTVKSFRLNGTTLMPNEDGQIGLGLQLRVAPVGKREGKVSLTTADGVELSHVVLDQPSGSGSGYYNVTQQHPLDTGYYTLQTAVAAVAAAGIPEGERKGMIITFEVGAGKWVDYRYKGDASDTQLASLAMWELHTALRGVQVGGELVEPVDGVVSLPELSVEVADSIDESDRPVASRAVKAELDRLKALTLDADTEPTDEGTQITLSQEGRQVVQFTVAGGGGGGDAITTKAKVSAQLSANRIKLGSPVSLAYSYTHYTDGEQDGLPATLHLTIRRGVQIVVSESLGLKASGERGELNLSTYITSADSYSISITASYNEGDTAKTRTASAQLSVVDLSISLYNRAEIESYLAGGGYKDGDTLSISLSVRGGAKAITMYLDGREHETKTLTGVGSRQTFVLPARSLRAGGHSLQFLASLDEVKSNSVYLDVLKAGEDSPWVGLLFSHPLGTIFSSGETPTLHASQYEQAGWHYIAIGRVGAGVANLKLEEGGRTTQLSAPRSYQRHTTRYLTKGRVACAYTLDDERKSFYVEVAPSSLEGLGVKEGAVLELLAAGRSNTESNPAVWSSGSSSTTFSDVDWRSSGWTGEALRLLNGAQARISHHLFGSDAKTTGMTLLLELRTTNVRSYDTPVVHCFDSAAHSEGQFGGVRITSDRISMPTGGQVIFRTEEGEEVSRDLGLDMQYASGEYYHLAIVVHPSSEERTVRLYINGVLSKADTYQDTVFRQRTPQGITLDSAGADLEVKQVRVYSTALTDDEVLSAYITDRPSIEEMQALRERNDVLDPQTGEVSWTKLYQKGKGILSITLDGGGLELLWGKSTDTKTNHLMRELIFRSPYGRAYDLKLTDAAIRRQGTSTSTYPVKNLRIYLQRKGFDTKVYRNVGKGNEDVWELVPERTYKMRPDSKPMSIINLKTDYADSSLCYNTGGAILLNDYLIKANPSLRTPGMVADPQARIGIDGMPIDVFTSDTPEGVKRYVGQFQFNNDKSKSGYLFGQTKKDGSEIALEFINNTNAVANFAIKGDVATQLASKGSDGFDASVEFLYPEQDYLWNGKGVEDTAPENIKQAVIRLWSWVQSCVPSGADPSAMTSEEVRRRFVSSKFKAEISKYFNPLNLAMWWVWTDYTMAVDQRVKNTFFRTWDGLVWWLTYYDGDTSMGKRNDAFLAYLYNINRDTRDLQRNKYAFEGHSSRLWALVLANMEAEIKAAATMMRTALTDSVFRRVYNQQMMGNWSERQYNKSGINKYIKPTYTDYNGTGTMNYIFALNGTMYAYRNQLIDRRFSLLDARYEVGAYHSDAVQGYIGKGSVATQIKAIAGDEYYFGWRTQNGQFRQHQGVPAGGIATFDFPDAISQNDPVRLIGASRMRKIDFSSTAPYLQGAWNFNGCRGLEEIVAPISSGQGTQWYPLMSKITGLKRIDLTGQSGVTGTEDEQARTFDVSSHTGLSELKLGGTRVQGVRIGAGSPLTRLELPASLSYLRLRALPKLSDEGLVVADWSGIRSLELAGCPRLNWRTILDKCTNIERIRIEGVDMLDDGSMLAKLSSVKGIDANGGGVDTCSLVGRCQLTKYIDEEVYARYQEHFPELSIRQPQYTMIELDETVLQSANMSNLDNHTGYKYGTPYVPSAHIRKIINGVHRVLGKQQVSGVMSVIRLHDEDSSKYHGASSTIGAKDAKTDGSQGDVWTYFPEFYYKGVNDILNNKKYAVYSTDANPDRPRGRKISGSELRTMEVERYQTYSPGATLQDCIVEMKDSSDYYRDCYPVAARIPCKGWKYASVPASENFLSVGIIFFDRSGRKLSFVSITPNSDYFVSGMNVLVPIPADAETIATCYPDFVQEDAYVWLTNSDNPADWEPDWVHSKAFLTSTFPLINQSGRLVSAVDPNINGLHRNQPFTYDRAAAETRGAIRVMDYEYTKNIINLWMMSEGSRNPYHGGTPPSIQRWETNEEDLLKVGMEQPSIDPSNHRYGFVWRNGVRMRVKWSMNSLGIANINNSIPQFLDRAIPWIKTKDAEKRSHARYGSANQWIYSIVCRTTNRQALGAYNGNDMNFRYTSFGRYMDILPCVKRGSGGASFTAGQGSILKGFLSKGYNSVLHIFRDNPWDGTIQFYTYGENGEAHRSWGSVRLLFDEKIKVVSSVEEYEQIPNNF